MNSQFATQTADTVENAIGAYLDDSTPAGIALKKEALVESLTDARDRIERALAAAERADTTTIWKELMFNAPFGQMDRNASRYIRAVREAAKQEDAA